MFKHLSPSQLLTVRAMGVALNAMRTLGGDGAEVTRKEINDYVDTFGGYRNKTLTKVGSSHTSWAMTYLTNTGAVEKTGTSTFKLTKIGQMIQYDEQIIEAYRVGRDLCASQKAAKAKTAKPAAKKPAAKRKSAPKKKAA